MSALVFQPMTGLGSLEFGLTEAKASSIASGMAGVRGLGYVDSRLALIKADPSGMEGLVYAGADILKMDYLEAALHFARTSASAGQSQGGSLYFNDLGCAILQFETHVREFLLFSSDYEQDEALRPVTLDQIRQYYDQQTAEFADEAGDEA